MRNMEQTVSRNVSIQNAATDARELPRRKANDVSEHGENLRSRKMHICLRFCEIFLVTVDIYLGALKNYPPPFFLPFDKGHNVNRVTVFVLIAIRSASVTFCGISHSGMRPIVQIDNWLTGASYQGTASCRYTTRRYPPVVTCGSKSWTLTVEEERALAVFEREILREIYGPVKENELWRIGRNSELEAIIKGENVVRFIKCQRIRWLGHIEGMQDNAIRKKLLYGKLYAARRRGRPKMRWLDDVSTDLREMGINEWRDRARDREAWGRIVKGAKANAGL